MRQTNGTILLEGPVTMKTVPGLMDRWTEAVRDGAARIDFAGVTEVDSAAIAAALGWFRAASSSGRKLEFTGLSETMVNLARLYGVEDLLIDAGN